MHKIILLVNLLPHTNDSSLSWHEQIRMREMDGEEVESPAAPLLARKTDGGDADGQLAVEPGLRQRLKGRNEGPNWFRCKPKFCQ